MNLLQCSNTSWLMLFAGNKKFLGSLSVCFLLVSINYDKLQKTVKVVDEIEIGQKKLFASTAMYDASLGFCNDR
jgi:hypothetical protein